MIRIVRDDAIEVARTIPAVDAVVTDPPYCSGGATEASRGVANSQGLRSETIAKGRFKWFGSDNMTTAGLCELLRLVCVRSQVTRRGHVLCFADWRMVTMIAPAMESAGYRFRSLIAWDKGHFGCGQGFRPQHEMILHLTRRSPKFFAADTGNVIRIAREGRDREHPTQKPVELMERLIRVVTGPEMLVFDPFSGSASTAIACHRLKRRFVGAESDPAIFDASIARVEAELKRQPMFEPSDVQTSFL